MFSETFLYYILYKYQQTEPVMAEQDETFVYIETAAEDDHKTIMKGGRFNRI